jgi:uncharacterized protein
VGRKTSGTAPAIALTRRELVRALVLGLGLPARVAVAGPGRRVGIIGGGMAGVSLAWLLDQDRDVVLLEARDAIGGNVRSLPLDIDGHSFVVDVGAQYFHPGPYPIYTALLDHLGLFDPDSPESGQGHAFPASITVFEGDHATPRFLSPALPQRAWPLFAPWNRDGLQAFAVAFREARRRETMRASWTVTMDEWLPTLGLSRPQWEGTLLPWAASLFSGDIEQARGLSARAAMIFAAKALPANPLDPILYDVLKAGMIEVLDRLMAQSPNTRFLTGAAVESVTRSGPGFVIRCDDGRCVVVDDLVFAASGPPTSRLLGGLPGTDAQRAALDGIEFHEARIAIHADPIYAPSRPAFRSFLNARIDSGYCEASMWLADVLVGAASGASPAPEAQIWKSWITHRSEAPGAILHEERFTHMLPSAATIRSQEALRALQGRDRIWFAGGYLHPYDSQETALRSALRVAIGLEAAGRHAALLGVASPGAGADQGLDTDGPSAERAGPND